MRVRGAAARAIEGAVAAVVVVEEEVVAAAVRRARFWERVVGPEEEDEGAVEEASARFRLRVSIQELNRHD